MLNSSPKAMESENISAKVEKSTTKGAVNGHRCVAELKIGGAVMGGRRRRICTIGSSDLNERERGLPTTLRAAGGLAPTAMPMPALLRTLSSLREEEEEEASSFSRWIRSPGRGRGAASSWEGNR